MLLPVACLWQYFNAGGAWDNAKKMIEADGGKGTDAHKAAVVGDTVGDPFKDTSGPSLNILLKLMSVVALVIAPSIAISSDTLTAYNTENTNVEVKKEIQVEMKKNDNDLVKAVVTITTMENGTENSNELIFEGSEEEVKEQIEALNEVDSNAKIRIEKQVKEVTKE